MKSTNGSVSGQLDEWMDDGRWMDWWVIVDGWMDGGKEELAEGWMDW